MTWEFHSHAIAWELQCMGMENYQFLKSVVGIMLPQQTLIILSEMLQLHLASSKFSPATIYGPPVEGFLLHY